MNRPSPDPSQEGNRHRSASCPFPSWEGLGVGSWSQCLRKSERRLSMNRSPELQLRQVRRGKKALSAPGWSPALQFHGSCSLAMTTGHWPLTTDRHFFHNNSPAPRSK